MDLKGIKLNGEVLSLPESGGSEAGLFEIPISAVSFLSQQLTEEELGYVNSNIDRIKSGAYVNVQGANIYGVITAVTPSRDMSSYFLTISSGFEVYSLNTEIGVIGIASSPHSNGGKEGQIPIISESRDGWTYIDPSEIGGSKPVFVMLSKQEISDGALSQETLMTYASSLDQALEYGFIIGLEEFNGESVVAYGHSLTADENYNINIIAQFTQAGKDYKIEISLHNNGESKLIIEEIKSGDTVPKKVTIRETRTIKNSDWSDKKASLDFKNLPLDTHIKIWPYNSSASAYLINGLVPNQKLGDGKYVVPKGTIIKLNDGTIDIDSVKKVFNKIVVAIEGQATDIYYIQMGGIAPDGVPSSSSDPVYSFNYFLMVDVGSAFIFAGIQNNPEDIDDEHKGDIDVIIAMTGPDGGSSDAAHLTLTADFVCSKEIYEWFKANSDIPQINPIAGAGCAVEFTCDTVPTKDIKLWVEYESEAKVKMTIPKGTVITLNGTIDVEGYKDISEYKPLNVTSSSSIPLYSIEMRGTGANSQNLVEQIAFNYIVWSPESEEGMMAGVSSVDIEGFLGGAALIYSIGNGDNVSLPFTLTADFTTDNKDLIQWFIDNSDLTEDKIKKEA